MVVPASQKEKSPSLVLFVAKEQGIQEHSGDSLDTLFRPLNENFQVIAQEMEEKLRDELLRYVIPTALRLPQIRNVFFKNYTLRCLDCLKMKLEWKTVFFELGGDSISAITLVGMAREEHNLQIKVASLFANPTIHEMAQTLEFVTPESMQTWAPFSMLKTSELQAITEQAIEQCQVSRDQIEDIYGCISLQEGLMSWSARNPGSFQARFIFRLPDTIDTQKFHEAWYKLRWFSSDDGDVAAADPMSYGTPLVRCIMNNSCRQKNEAPIFTLEKHHALFDKWSYEQILQVVEAAYESRTVELFQFAPFVHHLSTVIPECRNAPVPGIEKIVGPTIATLPVRTVLDRNDPIKVALSLLVVQPFSKNNQNPQTWLLKLGESLEDETKFCTYVLTVICELDVESVSVRAIFDAAVLSLDKVNAMLEQLEYLLTRLVDSVKSQTLAIEAAARNLIGNRHVYAEMITPKLTSNPRPLKLEGSSNTADLNEVEAWLQRSGRQQPKSEAERKLASIISRVLHLNPDEVFFTLGGDSISVMQVVSQCQRDKLSITAMDIFEGRTVRHITARSKQAAKLPPSMNLARMGSTNQIDPVQLQKAWYQLARRHAALRTILVEAALEDVEGGTLTHVVLDSYPREVKIICCTDDEAMHVLRHPTLNSRDNAGLFFRMSLLSAKPIRPRVFSWVSYALSLAECMDFWLEYLAGAKPCHFPRLPREIQPVTDFLNSVEVSLGHPSPPRKLCALNGLTITNLLQIAWGVVLRQHTSSDDVCFGTLVTGREAPRPGVHDIVGSILIQRSCVSAHSK
ncbi:hypothetical protein H112_02181 [Trichophyton rubrum D6]|uniref:Carrier domain-containing protein n=1 Tax=Trichophyton rubrum CBS 288.86 TaxID=1215330 RepID=A0A022W9Z2_TRIRU|nr:hypothetical protein H102_02176 [Trichophyton rubrum CBS 100081]EZF55177.1 hypothetical protein H103_02185 [Trichophyton rubrum CBS 288.86]EZF87110.1 hypothetical protein H110_02181 [Trichophyton rubrum MR1448]EZG19432.1 hypothetical protein H107_02250 [Trichophyton rubrum CBS 202.88]KDB36295.1 hypothetical protein H112_02181 [Trichophyton rubrum D6]